MSKLFTKGERITMIIPPVIEAKLTGVYQVDTADNRWLLHYTDGTTEEARCDISEEERENFFAIIGKVQDAARHPA